MISTDTSTATGVLTGPTQTIALGFYFMANTDLVVTRTRAGVITTLTLDSDYSVTGANNESGGSITVTGQASGDVITIVRTVPYTQLVDLVPLTKLSETLLERALDKLTMLCQQLKRSVDASGLLPTRIASTALGVDGAGNWVQRSASELFTFLKTYGGFFGTTSGAVAAGDHNHAGVYATAAQGSTADSTASALTSHTGNTSNPHAVTKAQVGLGNVDNTSDANKPVSTAALAALALKAPLASPALTGTPTAPTAAAGTNTTQIATTAILQAELDDLIHFSPILSKTGNGTGVATLTVTLSAPTTVRLDGYGYFYTDSGGTTGETQKKRLAAGSNTLYIKVKKSSSVITFLQGQRITQINSWTASTNAPSIAFSLADLLSGLTYLSVSGNNTISGSLADLPSGLTYLAIGGSSTCTYNTASGSRTWASGMRRISCRSNLATSLTSAMIDALLGDLSAQPTWATEKSIELKGARTSASDAAVATLTGYGVAVTVTA